MQMNSLLTSTVSVPGMAGDWLQQELMQRHSELDSYVVKSEKAERCKIENKTLQNERINETKLTFNIYQASFSAVLQLIYRSEVNKYEKAAQELPVSHPQIFSVG